MAAAKRTLKLSKDLFNLFAAPPQTLILFLRSLAGALNGYAALYREMSDFALSLAVRWADGDLVDIELRVAFKDWTGSDTAYATREDPRSFAASLDDMAANGRVATLDIGQPDLGYAACRVFEYGGPRHLGIDVVLARGGGATGRDADHGRVLQLSVPVERGQLATFANAIRRIVENETGIATLQLPTDWP